MSFLKFILILVNFKSNFGDYCDAKKENCNENSHIEDKLIVAAIDFGTTYSGWAYSSVNNPHDIKTKRWYSTRHVSPKTPTVILIKPDGETLDSFGYNAEMKYSQLTAEGNHRFYYYFRRFKMMLHNKTGLKRDITLKDEHGRELPGLTVFSLAIQYLRQDLNKSLTTKDSQLREADVSWVLTVPAIWNDNAKQFMREAAIKAGIDGTYLKIALEPEAASLFCRKSATFKDGHTLAEGFKPETKYMIIDAGGGTVDIAFHEVLENGNLKEIHKAEGGPWGGVNVDDTFLAMLSSLFGENVMSKFKNECTYEYFLMLRDFEINKREISPSTDNKMIFIIPTCLSNIITEIWRKSINDLIAASQFKGKLLLKNDRLIIASNMSKNIFQDTLDKIVKKLKSLFQEQGLSELYMLCLAGGFSESEMLHHSIESNFPSKKIIPPDHPSLAVLKGSVIFGHNPSVISERVLRLTYGVSCLREFKEGEHDPNKKKEIEGRIYCEDIFCSVVDKDSAVEIGKEHGGHSFIPSSETATAHHLKIFGCTESSPKYKTDESCSQIGEVIADIYDLSVKRTERSVLVYFKFSGPEIEVKAKDKKTGIETKAIIDFLG